MSAPVFGLTEDAQLPSISKLNKPPGHKPSLPLSKLRIRSPRPPYSHAPFLPPRTTPCPTWVMLISRVTPLAANSLRKPFQSPVSVERDQKSPEYGSFAEESCAPACAPSNIPNQNMIGPTILDVFIKLTLGRGGKTGGPRRFCDNYTRTICTNVCVCAKFGNNSLTAVRACPVCLRLVFVQSGPRLFAVAVRRFPGF